MPSAAENHMCVKCDERLNKQVKILTSLCIGTCKSAYTKGLCPKLCTNLTIVPVKEKIITI